MLFTLYELALVRCANEVSQCYYCKILIGYLGFPLKNILISIVLLIVYTPVRCSRWWAMETNMATKCVYEFMSALNLMREIREHVRHFESFVIRPVVVQDFWPTCMWFELCLPWSFVQVSLCVWYDQTAIHVFLQQQTNRNRLISICQLLSRFVNHICA